MPHPGPVGAATAAGGARHTRLVPGFVVGTRLGPGAGVVTFANGMVVREPIVSIDPAARRLVWSAETGMLRHYNASAQVMPDGGGSRVVWVADLLPDEAAHAVEGMMEEGMAAMKRALDAANSRARQSSP